MLRISFGFTWLLTLVARLHGMPDFMKHSALIVWKANHNMKLRRQVTRSCSCFTSVSTSARILQLWYQQGETQTWRSMRMWRKLTWTLTHPTPQPKTWRSMCMWRKLTWTLTHPTPDPVTYACFQRARLLARFSRRWQKTRCCQRTRMLTSIFWHRS